MLTVLLPSVYGPNVYGPAANATVPVAPESTVRVAFEPSEK